MNKLNELIIRADAFVTSMKDEEGSEVAQAAGVALVAAALIGAMSGVLGTLTGAVQNAFNNLASALGF